MRQVYYSIRDNNDYPICFGETIQKVKKKAKDWIRDYPKFYPAPFKLVKIETTEMKKFKK